MKTDRQGPRGLWKRTPLLLLGALLGLSACSETVPAEPPGNYPTGMFFVDVQSDLGEISRFVRGSNHGPWADLGVWNAEPARESGITFLRWPGGNWGDRNDLQAWMVDNYIGQAKMMNAEPSITVRLPNSTPEAAAAWVYYVNVEKKYGVKYWSIGNEPSLYEADTSLGGVWDAVTYSKRWREFAVAMRRVDPSILLFGPDTHQFTGDPKTDPKDSKGKDYLREFLKRNADLVDIVTVHRYSFPRCPTCGAPSKAELLADTPGWDDLIPGLRRVIREVTGKDLPVGVTEFNSNYSNVSGGETSPDSFLGALWTADVLGRMIRQRPELLAYWTLKTGSSDAGHALMTSYALRPSYFVFQLYKRFGTRLLAANSDDPAVSLFAAKRDDGAVTLIFVNRGDASVKKVLQLAGGGGLRLTESYLFDLSRMAEPMIVPAFVNGDAVVLPALSATLFIFEPG
jgi:hypothetical protein